MPEPSNRELDAIVSQVVAEARIDRDLILPEEIDYIRQHVLKKPLRIIHIRKEPTLARPYTIPVYPWMPLFVVLLSVVAAYLYGWVNQNVIWPTVFLYVAALVWYGVWGRTRVLPVAPEEVAARIAARLAQQAPGATSGPGATSASVPEAGSSRLERLTGPVLLLGVLSLGCRE
jgi:hypothetical protein